MASEALLTEVGRIVVTLSNIENRLCHLFLVLNPHVGISRASDHFYSMSNFDHRLKLTDFTVDCFATDAERRTWQKILGKLNQHRSTRNQVAHQGMAHSYRLGEGYLETFLDSSALNRKKKGRKL